VVTTDISLACGIASRCLLVYPVGVVSFCITFRHNPFRVYPVWEEVGFGKSEVLNCFCL